MDKIGIDNLGILQIDEFQDYQVEDVVIFAVTFPDWFQYSEGMIQFIKAHNQNVANGGLMFKDDFSLLRYSYNVAKNPELFNFRRYEDAN